MSDRPNCLGKLNRLLTLAISPEFYRAVIATRDNLSRIEAIDTENEAIVALEIHHVGPVQRPQLYSLIVRNRGEAIELGHFTETTHNILMRQEFLFHDPVVPQSNLLVLTARDRDAVWKRQN